MTWPSRAHRERAELGNRAGVTAAAIIRYLSTVTVTCGEKLRVALARKRLGSVLRGPSAGSDAARHAEAKT